MTEILHRGSCKDLACYMGPHHDRDSSQMSSQGLACYKGPQPTLMEIQGALMSDLVWYRGPHFYTDKQYGVRLVSTQWSGPKSCITINITSFIKCLQQTPTTYFMWYEGPDCINNGARGFITAITLIFNMSAMYWIYLMGFLQRHKKIHWNMFF